jgi:prefoldin subunit 5
VDGRIPLRRLVGIGDYLFTNHEFGQASKIIVEIGDFSWEG